MRRNNDDQTISAERNSERRCCLESAEPIIAGSTFVLRHHDVQRMPALPKARSAADFAFSANTRSVSVVVRF
jgi:hypothetical protein